MATKRGLSEGTAGANADVSPNKRKRLNPDGAASDPIASFSNLPSDCKVHIFSNLSTDDLNNVAFVSRDCRDARNNDSLNQERTGTIIWTDNTTANSFSNKLQEVADVFTGNRTRLKFEGIDRIPIQSNSPIREDVSLPEVTSLDMSVPNEGNKTPFQVFRFIGSIFPNLQELDLSNLALGYGEAFIGDVLRRCSGLSRFTWKGSKGLWFCGFDLRNFIGSLTELNLDNSVISWQFVRRERDHLELAEYVYDPTCYLLMRCHHLERLSLKGTHLESYVLRRRDHWESEPLPQDVLIKMVRNHPTLRWLRSDLTMENVAMLKQERPEITFVSD